MTTGNSLSERLGMAVKSERWQGYRAGGGPWCRQRQQVQPQRQQQHQQQACSWNTILLRDSFYENL